MHRAKQAAPGRGQPLPCTRSDLLSRKCDIPSPAATSRSWMNAWQLPSHPRKGRGLLGIIGVGEERGVKVSPQTQIPRVKKKKKKATLGVGVCKGKACMLQGCFLVGASSSAPTETTCVCSPAHHHTLRVAPPTAQVTTSVPSLTEIPHGRAPISASGSNSA